MELQSGAVMSQTTIILEKNMVTLLAKFSIVLVLVLCMRMFVCAARLLYVLIEKKLEFGVTGKTSLKHVRKSKIRILKL